MKNIYLYIQGCCISAAVARTSSDGQTNLLEGQDGGTGERQEKVY